MGLSLIYQHFKDKDGNLYFPTYSIFYGEFIRQIQTPAGEVLDASDGKPFEDKMLELGFSYKEFYGEKLFGSYDNWDHFTSRVFCSSNGEPGREEKLK